MVMTLSISGGRAAHVGARDGSSLPDRDAYGDWCAAGPAATS